MAERLVYKSVLVLLCLILTACTTMAVPAPTVTHEATASGAITHNAPQSSLTQNPTASSTLPGPTKPADSPLDLSAINITLEDLPAGFSPTPSALRGQLGLTPQELSAAFQNAFGGAEATSLISFINPNRLSYEMVTSVIFYPVSAGQQAAIAAELQNPDDTLTAFSQAFGGRSEILPDFKPCGQASMGMIVTSNSGALTLKGELVIFLRGSAAVLICVLYRAGNKPAVSSTVLCPLLDQRLTAILTR